jgi:hypothetical protein
MPPTSGRIDIRAIVECLLAAHYSDREILDYLVWPLGLAEPDAGAALEAVRGPVRFVERGCSPTERPQARH